MQVINAIGFLLTYCEIVINFFIFIYVVKVVCFLTNDPLPEDESIESHLANIRSVHNLQLYKLTSLYLVETLSFDLESILKRVRQNFNIYIPELDELVKDPIKHLLVKITRISRIFNKQYVKVDQLYQNLFDKLFVALVNTSAPLEMLLGPNRLLGH